MPTTPFDHNQLFRKFSYETTPEPAVKPQLKALKGIRAVVFDVYGTLFQSPTDDLSLVDDKSSKQCDESMVRESLKATGFILQDEATPIAELLLDTIKAERDIKREQGTEYPEVDILGVWEDLIGQLEAYEIIRGKVTRSKLKQLATHYEARVTPVCPMPGVLEAIERLLDQNVSLGIVSNAQYYTPLLFEAFFEDNPGDLGFEEIACIWSYEHGTAKPGTELYTLCAERLQALDGIPAEAVLHVGNDRRNDVWPAQKVGFKTALFAGDKRSYRPRENDPALNGVTPDIVVTTLDQVAECLA